MGMLASCCSRAKIRCLSRLFPLLFPRDDNRHYEETPVSSSFPLWLIHQILGHHLLLSEVNFWDLKQLPQGLRKPLVPSINWMAWCEFSSYCLCPAARPAWVTWFRWAKHCPQLENPSIKGFLQATCDCVAWWALHIHTGQVKAVTFTGCQRKGILKNGEHFYSITVR